MPKSLRKWRERRWKIDPHCEKCGVETIRPQDVPGVRFKPDGTPIIKKIPDNMATVQHRFDRLHPQRRGNSRERKRYLWCYKCNHEYYKTVEEPRHKQQSLTENGYVKGGDNEE